MRSSVVKPALAPGYQRTRIPGAEPLRRLLENAAISVSAGGGGPKVNFLEPAGDPGLLGPQSVAWRVHCDFALMLAGGVSALLLQALHPLALAGVWDHSSFRTDILGRLRRTASFVGVTTYASRRDAEAWIAHVRAIHLSVTGTAPDGRPYAASEPALLTWVHVAEVSSFLRAHQCYARRPLDEAEQDRYYAEIAVVAEGLGATDVPKSRAAVEAYFGRMRPQLAYTERTREVYRILLDAPAPSPRLRPFGRLLVQAGVDLLPDWAAALMHTERGAALRRASLRPAMLTIAASLRWALRNGASAKARRRTAVPGAPG